MRHAAFGGMDFSTAESVLGHVFSGHGLYHFRTSEEHVGDAFGHNGEVGEGGRVHGTAGTGAEDG